ncbi:hypothetical protein Ami103574_02560 [Aminipila butyrica]|uniref:Uncharacterized protein n=1 Tax=Aminipila butyrica TaxID=433296 RepID=A0A858BSD8_9FIRM|nr:hypothetical protein [Aminipila butyrica]QIB68262.1 hypothetical protein Ami103574_02560 [Aminipila butyrica]
MTPDYEFYTDVYFGNQITKADFPRLIARASAYLDGICNLQSAPPESAKMALCAVAEAWQTNEQGGDVVSQSVGSWSKSYAQKKIKTDDVRLTDAAKLYLGQYCNLTVRWV